MRRRQPTKKSWNSLPVFLAPAYEINEEDLVSSDERKKCVELGRLVGAMKEKTAKISHEDKIKLLTLTSESWSISKTFTEFSVSHHIVKNDKITKCQRDSCWTW